MSMKVTLAQETQSSLRSKKDEDDNGMETKRNEVMPKHDCLLR